MSLTGQDSYRQWPVHPRQGCRAVNCRHHCRNALALLDRRYCGWQRDWVFVNPMLANAITGPGCWRQQQNGPGNRPIHFLCRPPQGSRLEEESVLLFLVSLPLVQKP
jgi:hypothetical protein